MLSPVDMVAGINKAFKQTTGIGDHRSLHAKGRFYTATFTATPEAAALCRAGHLRGEPVPVWVRWSNGGGNPKTPDKAPDVRGMAVSFRLPDGTATDLLCQTAPRFPIKTPEMFLELVRAANSPARLPLFLARHPSALAALAVNAKAGSIKSPASYAEATFYPIHAYKWIAPDGTESWVRYTLTPLATDADRLPERFEGPDRLQEEILARLERGPVRFRLDVRVAGPGDDPHDPTSVWSDAARLVDAGTIEVTGLDPDREQNGEVVVFDPVRIVDGIELSDDPILNYRPGAYSESVRRRTAKA
jgi:catalase